MVPNIKVLRNTSKKQPNNKAWEWSSNSYVKQCILLKNADLCFHHIET